MSLKSYLDLVNKKRAWEGVLLFGLYMVLMLTFLNQDTTFCDENDNYMGGMIVANGGLLYKDFCSQHMPVMYYICAIFYLLGARNVYQYRVMFFALMAIIWVAMYFRYKKYFGSCVMILGPAIYASTIATGDLTYSAVLSDRLQGMGLVILFFEYLLATIHRKNVTFATCCWISLSIFISFGSVFVSIFGIFAIALSWLIFEIGECYKSHKLKQSIPYLFRKYWRTVLTVATPFIILLIYFVCTNTLLNFINSAYILNTRIYSKYMSGYGSNIVKAMIDPISGFFSILQTTIQNFSGQPFSAAFTLLLLMGNILFALKISLSDKWIGLSVMYIITQCAPRGYFNFHSVAYYMLSSYMLAAVIGWGAEWMRMRTDKNMAATISVCTVVFVMAPYFGSISNIVDVPTVLGNIEPSPKAQLIQDLTDEGEKVGCTDGVVMVATLVEADRCYINGASSTPWTYEAFGDLERLMLQQQMPRIIFYSADYAVWDNLYTDYAGETEQFILENYIQVKDDIWARRDYFEQASMIAQKYE